MKSMEEFEWSIWRKFPIPRRQDNLIAPFFYGMYQLRNALTGEYILFGVGKNCAYRMSSLLPHPFGQGTRRNEIKKDFVLKNIDNIEYRTVAFINEAEMKSAEKQIKDLRAHKFNT